MFGTIPRLGDFGISAATNYHEDWTSLPDPISLDPEDLALVQALVLTSSQI